MPVSDLSSVAQDYLKIIWSATEWSDEPVTVKQLSERMGVRAATVSDGIRRLADQGLVLHERYGEVGLTEAGRRHAVAMVRRHRLIETFLVEELGYGWDEVHDEAETLEHAVSDTFIDRMAAKLGHPVRDPHGDPIPAADGSVLMPPAVRMSELADGQGGRITRISDENPDLLRYLATERIELDAAVAVLGRKPFGGPLMVRIAGPDGSRELDLADGVADALWVHPESADTDQRGS